MADTSEKVSDNFVDQALRLHRTVFSIPTLRQFLIGCDNTYGEKNPFDSLGKVDLISRRVKGQQATCWALRSLLDMWQQGAVGEKLAERQIDGRAQGCGGKGLVELATFKKTIRQQLIGFSARPSPGLDCRGRG